MPRLQQIAVVQQQAPGPFGGISLIGLDESGTLIWRGFLGRDGKGEETVTWKQINEPDPR